MGGRALFSAEPFPALYSVETCWSWPPWQVGTSVVNEDQLELPRLLGSHFAMRAPCAMRIHWKFSNLGSISRVRWEATVPNRPPDSGRGQPDFQGSCSRGLSSRWSRDPLQCWQECASGLHGETVPFQNNFIDGQLAVILAKLGLKESVRKVSAPTSAKATPLSWTGKAVLPSHRRRILDAHVDKRRKQRSHAQEMPSRAHSLSCWAWYCRPW